MIYARLDEAIADLESRLLVRLGYPPAIIFKNERTKYLSAMRKADSGDLGPIGELIARSVTNNLYRFVIPAIAGPARLMPLASLADKKSGLTANALRVAAIRGRLRAQKSGQGTWLSSKKWVQEYRKKKYSRAEPQARLPATSLGVAASKTSPHRGSIQGHGVGDLGRTSWQVLGMTSPRSSTYAP